MVAIDGLPVRNAARAAARDRVVKPAVATTFTIEANGKLLLATLVRSEATEQKRFREAWVSFPVARLLSFAGSFLIPALFIPAAILLFARRRREAVPACLSLAFLILAFMLSGAGLLEISIDILDFLAIVAGFLLFAAILAFPAGRLTAMDGCPFRSTYHLLIESTLLDLRFRPLPRLPYHRYRKVDQGGTPATSMAFWVS